MSSIQISAFGKYHTSSKLFLSNIMLFSDAIFIHSLQHFYTTPFVPFLNVEFENIEIIKFINLLSYMICPLCCVDVIPECMCSLFFHIFIMHYGKCFSANVVFYTVSLESYVAPCVHVLHVPGVHNQQVFCSLCQVTSGVIMLLPSRLTKSDKDISNKGYVEGMCAVFLGCCVAGLRSLLGYCKRL